MDMRNYKILKRKSIEYEKLLKEGKISLEDIGDKLCTKCMKIKHQDTDNFYLKMIRSKENLYFPVFSTYCIACICYDQKQSGKLFSKKQTETLTGHRVCKKCSKNKPLNKDNFRLTQGKYLRRVCLDCDRLEANDLQKKRLVYAKDSIRLARRKYQINRRKSDPVYRMRKYISTQIYSALRKQKSKKDTSIMNYLPYSINDLKSHLESQFESWMNWDNMGKYDNKSWDDNNDSTWKWNIDHIIPQSKLPYTSMKDDNFKICWALNNLRPLSAKQNILDGVRLAHYGK